MKRQGGVSMIHEYLRLVQQGPMPRPPPPPPPEALSPEALFARGVAQHRSLFDDLEALRPAVCDAGALLADTLRCGGRLLFFGDGASAADSLHLAAEFNGRLRRGRVQPAAVALGAATLAAIANGYGYEQVFERQIHVHGRPGDCAVALSVGGRAPDVLRGLQAARAQNMASVALLGGGGGVALTLALADLAVVVPHEDSARVQEAHLFIGHLWCSQIDSALGLPA